VPTVETTQHELVLVRHAAATGQDADAPLTVEGERQAHQLTAVLVSLAVARVIASPFLRARASIAPFCAHAALPLDTDDRLVERVLSRASPPDWRAHLQRSFTEPDYRLPDGESARTAQARGLAVVQTAWASGARCALVTHGNLLALLLQAIDPTVGYDAWAALSNPDVFVVYGNATGPVGFRRVWAS
jgi:2,3-bisphosphoglycerate-dependent phosphoglycerate mutase